MLDPLDGFLNARSDSHRNADVRRALGPFARMAERTGVAVIGIMHTRKSGGSGPETVSLDRTMGSRAWGAAARCVWSIFADEHNPGRRLMLKSKLNLAIAAPGTAPPASRSTRIRLAGSTASPTSRKRS
jgi:hypothetical protein